MADEWISVADAISKYPEANSINPQRAVMLVAKLAEDEVVASRIALVEDGRGHQAQRDVSMTRNDWEDLFRLESNDWFTRGNAAFPDDTVWRGIQIHAGDLEVYLKGERPKSAPWIEEFVSKPSFVSLSEALSWIAFQKFMNKDQLELILSGQEDSGDDSAITDAMAKLSEQATGGTVRLVGKYLERPSANEIDILHAPIDPDRVHDFRRVELRHDGLARGFGIFSEVAVPETDSDRPKDSWRFVRVCRAELLTAFPPNATVQGENVPANRQLDHAEIIASAQGMREERPSISIGSAAASIVADLPRNPRTGRPRDQRHIERLIAPLWEGEVAESPP